MIRRLSRNVPRRSTYILALSLLLLVAAPASARLDTTDRTLAATWSGQWSSEWGTMALTQSGSSMQGTYPHDQGHIAGTISGNVFTGRWDEAPSRAGPGDAGAVILTMAADGKSFTGRWNYDGDQTFRTNWNGRCIGGACLSGDSPKCSPSNVGNARRNAINEVRVVSVQPDVQVHRAGTGDDCWVVATRDMVLKQGDEVSADPDGSVTLQFADNSTVVVRNTTQLKIASFFTEGGVVRTEILLRMGEIAATVNKSEATKSDFTIKSPSAVTSRRGTTLTVSYDPINKVTVTSVSSGLGIVDPSKPGLPTVLVPAGKEVQVTASSMSKVVAIGQAGTPPGAVSRAKARALVFKQLARYDERCKIKVVAFGLKPALRGWLASVKVRGNQQGWATWRVTGAKAAASNPLAKLLVAGCR